MSTVATVAATPPPAAVGSTAAASPAPQGVTGQAAAVPNQIDTAAIASISNTVRSSPGTAGLGVVNGEVTVVASTPADEQSVANGAPSVAAIQSALTAVQLALDNQPAEHPNSPSVVELENKEGELQQALLQVQSGQSGSNAVYLSGVVLNTAV